MEDVEDANPGSSVRSGWLNRLVGTDADANPLQGLAMGSGVAPASLFVAAFATLITSGASAIAKA